MLNSKVNNLLEGIRENSCSYNGFDKFVIDSLVGYVKEYLEILTILGYIDDNNIDSIREQLSKIKAILPYRFYFDDEKELLLINDEQKDDNLLTRKEKTQLDAYQKIGEYILQSLHAHNIRLESVAMSSSRLVATADIINGFHFLNKAISQELAEQVFSYKTGKFRVPRFINSSIMFGHQIETDFYNNVDFEEPARLFSGALLNEDKCSAFLELTQISFDEDFITDISCLVNDDIVTLLMGLGYIKEFKDRECHNPNQASLAMTLLEKYYNNTKDTFIKKHLI